jgi:hypothetical protein
MRSPIQGKGGLLAGVLAGPGWTGGRRDQFPEAIRVPPHKVGCIPAVPIGSVSAHLR